MSYDNIPSFEGSIKLYTLKIINSTFWRFEPCYSKEDLLQEAHLVYLKMVDRYHNAVDNPKWFMALYKTSLSNRYNDLSVLATKYRKEVTSIVTPETETDILDTLMSDDFSSHEIENLYKNAPYHIKQVLDLFIKKPEILQTLSKAWKRQGKKQPLGNEHLCTLFGLDASITDIVSEVENYLTEE